MSESGGSEEELEQTNVLDPPHEVVFRLQTARASEPAPRERQPVASPPHAGHLSRAARVQRAFAVPGSEKQAPTTLTWQRTARAMPCAEALMPG
jgi:hypothetical protein